MLFLIKINFSIVAFRSCSKQMFYFMFWEFSTNDVCHDNLLFVMWGYEKEFSLKLVILRRHLLLKQLQFQEKSAFRSLQIDTKIIFLQNGFNEHIVLSGKFKVIFEDGKAS